MNAFTLATGRARLLILGALLATALALPSLVPSAQAGAPPAKPELHVTSSEARFIAGSLVYPTGWYLVFYVQNTGIVDAGAFQVAVKDITTGQTVETFARPGLAAGKRHLFVHKLPAPHCADWVNRTIVVDSGKTVAESNEANNTAVVGGWYGDVC